MTGENGGRQGSLYRRREYIADVLRIHEQGQYVRVERSKILAAHMAIAAEEEEGRRTKGYQRSRGRIEQECVPKCRLEARDTRREGW